MSEEFKKTEEEIQASRPKWCPQCAGPISPDRTAAVLVGDDREGYAWDTICQWCKWSGDIAPDSVN